MFDKPRAGWCFFTLGDFEFRFSYLRDTPQEFIDGLIFSINNFMPFSVILDGENKGEALLVSDSYETYIIQNLSDNEDCDNKIITKRFDIGKIEIARMFLEDMEKYKEEFSWWDVAEEQKYYDLSELFRAMETHEEKRKEIIPFIKKEEKR